MVTNYKLLLLNDNPSLLQNWFRIWHFRRVIRFNETILSSITISLADHYNSIRPSDFSPIRHLVSVESGCGSIGRVVAFDTRGLRFDSSHRQNFIEQSSIINCIEKTKLNKKRPGMAHFFLKKMLKLLFVGYIRRIIWLYFPTKHKQNGSGGHD